MEIIWARGESSVREVSQDLDRPLAYTTVMTTLDRLFKKGLLRRIKFARAFVYSPALTSEQWEERRTVELIAEFFSGPLPSNELLISCLVDAVGATDSALLDELEEKIKLKRQELQGKDKR